MRDILLDFSAMVLIARKEKKNINTEIYTSVQML